MSSEAVPGRLNGFTSPFSPAQVAAWAALGCLSLEWLMIIAPILPVAASAILTLVYLALVGLVLYYGGQTQAIDPMDPYLGKHLIQSSRLPTTTKLYRYFNPVTQYTDVAAEAVTNVESQQEVTLKQCWLCDTQVKPKSLHCKFCNKCVDEFDHHCMWLNTCIGKRNYQLFYRTMLALCGMLVLHFLVSISLVSASAQDNGGTRFRMESWGGPNLDGSSSSVAAIRALLIVFIIFDLASLFLLGQLILFHVDLQRKGLSTYEFIVQDMETKRQRSRQQAELSSLRVREINKAKNHGRNVYAQRLVVGGYCRNHFKCAACDPLELPQKQEATNVDPSAIAQQGFSMALGGGTLFVNDPSDDDEDNEEQPESIEKPSRQENGVTFVAVSNGARTENNDDDDDDDAQPMDEPAADAAASSGEQSTLASLDNNDSTRPAEQPTRQAYSQAQQRDDHDNEDDAPSDEESLMNM